VATKPQSHDSHPICPTCQSDLTGRKSLPRFASERGDDPLKNDEVGSLSEEANTLVNLLGALAQAAPLAVAYYADNMDGHVPDWIDDLAHLAEELTGETKRRLELVCDAGTLWRQRAEGKED
jgi:hypothetical protein